MSVRDKLRLAAEKLPLEPHEYAQSPRQNREGCQQVPMGLGGLLLFRCALPGRGFQRELPSIITNGQKLVLICQKKSVAFRELFFLFGGFCEGTGSEAEALLMRRSFAAF